MAGKETQASIAQWAEETFGPVGDYTALVDRAVTEMSELREAVSLNNTVEIGKETADVMILLYRLCALNGLDLQTEVNHKMSENRARKWRNTGDGTGSHIK